MPGLFLRRHQRQGLRGGTGTRGRRVGRPRSVTVGWQSKKGEDGRNGRMGEDGRRRRGSRSSPVIAQSPTSSVVGDQPRPPRHQTAIAEDPDQHHPRGSCPRAQNATPCPSPAGRPPSTWSRNHSPARLAGTAIVIRSPENQHVTRTSGTTHARTMIPLMAPEAPTIGMCLPDSPPFRRAAARPEDIKRK
jgi:hypothetical protein